MSDRIEAEKVMGSSAAGRIAAPLRGEVGVADHLVVHVRQCSSRRNNSLLTIDSRAILGSSTSCYQAERTHLQYGANTGTIIGTRLLADKASFLDQQPLARDPTCIYE